MANRINVKLILELKSGGMSQAEIARTRHMSRTSISAVVRIAREKSISFEDIKDLNDDVIYRMFFPEKMITEDMYELPDYEYVHRISSDRLETGENADKLCEQDSAFGA